MNLMEFLRSRLQGCYCLQESLALHTWYKIGGPAAILAMVSDTESLKELLAICREEKVPWFILGKGANVLASDEGFAGVVIKLTGEFTQFKAGNLTLEAGAAMDLQELIIFCEQKGWGGLEYLSGIPGTIGGALTMNAGTDKVVIGDLVEEVTVLDAELIIRRLPAREIEFGYRQVPELRDKVILGCQLRLQQDDTDRLRKIRLEQLAWRREKQPLDYPSCGSVFKRPPGDFAGRLIEAAGLKGYRYGEAMISDKHAGFIVNLGKARASDVEYLINMIREKVWAEFRVKLETEVKYLGNTDRLG
ncbi:MAG: UDP-N-acetylmuramate dehydrogenase, partial [Candidatus Cloacimonetes bacterium]|nr:UDP-N-acetylmuramate dehydrogenase [Candidatus Cloacimonadota bacterium]